MSKLYDSKKDASELSSSIANLKLAANLLEEYGLQALDIVSAFKQQQEPIAWMYEHDGCMDKPILTTEKWFTCNEPWNETPLFTGAARQTAPDTDAVEALKELVACKMLEYEILSLRSDPYYITQADIAQNDYDRRIDAAWKKARVIVRSKI